MSVYLPPDGSHLAETDGWLSRDMVCVCVCVCVILLEWCQASRYHSLSYAVIMSAPCQSDTENLKNILISLKISNFIVAVWFHVK